MSFLLICVFTAAKAQDLIPKFKEDTTMSVNLDSSPIACSLTDLELVERKNELRTNIFSKAKKMEEVDDGYLFHFDDSDKMLPVLFEYILAEKECCPFFKQDISIYPGDEGVVWKISGPEGVKDLLKDIFKIVSKK